VGFIRRLPTDLIEAFASTLEESMNADLLVHVVDASDPDPTGQIQAVREVLASIDAESIPEQIAINKIDLVDDEVRARLRGAYPDAVMISTLTGEGIEDLRTRIEERLPELDALVECLIPYDRGDLLDRIHHQGRVESIDHTENGTRVRAYVDPALQGALAPYLV